MCSLLHSQHLDRRDKFSLEICDHLALWDAPKVTCKLGPPSGRSGSVEPPTEDTKVALPVERGLEECHIRIVQVVNELPSVQCCFSTGRDCLYPVESPIPDL